MAVNAKALRKAIRAIEKHPEQWDQGDWVKGETKELEIMGQKLVLVEVGTKCNTTMCLAGMVVQQAGWAPLLSNELFDPEDLDPNEAIAVEHCINLKTGETRQIEALAQEILGFTYQQASYIFDSDAGDKDIEKFKSLITNKTGVEFPAKKEK